jgi:dTDP-4-amino-4,6-dideoxygalactose transaminase
MKINERTEGRVINFFDLSRSHDPLRDQFHKVLDRVIDSSEYVLGSTVNEFETEFAKYCNSKYSVATNSGTSALHLALEACGVKAGDEVITTSMTFIATSAAISYLNAIPVFVDVDPLTWNLDPEKIEAAITPRTKAIMPVHLHGLMADMPRIMEIAAKYDLKVIEDSAQAHGASIAGVRSSGFGDVTGYSFYPGKNLGALGEAGAVVTNSSEIADRIRLMRNWGSPVRYVHDDIAFNYRMEGIQGGFLSVKLPHMEEWTSDRQRIAARYSAALSPKGIQCPNTPNGYEHVFHVYAILSNDRDALAAKFNERQIGHGVHYPIAVHLQKAYAHLGHEGGSFPITENLAKSFFSLPIFPGMTDVEVDFVIDTILETEKTQ